MAKKLTPLQKEFNKELKNLKSRIKTAESKGFVFSDDLTKPRQKVSRKLIERIKSYRGEKLYQKGGFVNPETGEYIQGKEGIYEQRKQEYKEKREKKKGRDNREDTANKIIEEFLNSVQSIGEINSGSPSTQELRQNGVNRITQAVNNSISDEGLLETALNIQNNADELQGSIMILYDSDGGAVAQGITDILEIINQRPLTFEENAELFGDISFEDF